MKLKHYKLSFLLILLIFGYGCQTVSSQQNINPLIATNGLIDIKTNHKYSLSLLFYETVFANNLPGILVKIRNDKNQEERFLFEINRQLISKESRNLWSASEEFLVIPARDEINIYQAKAIKKVFNKPDAFKKNSIVAAIKPIDNILIFVEKSDQIFSHAFVKWNEDNSIIFNVSSENINANSENIYFNQFRYDLSQKKLFRRCPKVENTKCLSSDSLELIGRRKIVVNYRKGIINTAQIKIEYQ